MAVLSYHTRLRRNSLLWWGHALKINSSTAAGAVWQQKSLSNYNCIAKQQELGQPAHDDNTSLSMQRPAAVTGHTDKQIKSYKATAASGCQLTSH